MSRLSNVIFAPFAGYLDQKALEFIGADRVGVDFARPYGEPALVHQSSVSWQVFKNPVALFTGGIAAVLLELAEPRVRAGVWGHSTFRQDPVGRLKRTGLAAMVTVFAPGSTATAMIKGVNRRHGKVVGTTPEGLNYDARSPDLLSWVHGTASFGFLEAYCRYCAPLSAEDKSSFYAEGQKSAGLYGAINAPLSLQAQQAFFERWEDCLEGAPEIHEFLDIMKAAKALPGPVRLSQKLLIRAGVDVLPEELKIRLGLEGKGLRGAHERLVVQRMGRRANRLILKRSPAVQACRRLGLSDDYLFRARS
ncbi:MAG: oxygenase MpaB family protein [Pseudomonadota bacterium]